MRERVNTDKIRLVKTFFHFYATSKPYEKLAHSLVSNVSLKITINVSVVYMVGYVVVLRGANP